MEEGLVNIDRRTNLIHVALELFLEKGYEHTRIDDIIEKVGIAKGTYYHYFKSKLSVLEAVVEHLIAHYIKQLEEISKLNIPATEKMILLWDGFNNLGNTASVLQELMKDEENSLLLYRLVRKGMIESIPPHEKIINQGLTEGTFHTPHPNMVAKILPLIIASTFAIDNVAEKQALFHFSNKILEIDEEPDIPNHI